MFKANLPPNVWSYFMINLQAGLLHMDKCITVYHLSICWRNFPHFNFFLYFQVIEITSVSGYCQFI